MSGEGGSRYSIGVDIGGTFTDCVVLADDGRRWIAKVPSTPPDFERGFMGSIEAAANQIGIDLDELVRSASGVYHGCTVGTNALVESRTAAVGVLTTAGHRDSLFTMQSGGRLLGLDPAYVAHLALHDKPAPLVEKKLVEEVDERVAFDGNVVVSLNEERCRAAIARLLEAEVEAFAVSLLWSIANPAHERRVAELIREAAPDAFVSVSSEVGSRPGEYQRTVATVINAMIGPVTSTYLLLVEGQLAELGYDGTLYIMSCTGGVIDSPFARALPLLTIGSGPVAGVTGAGNLARLTNPSSNGDQPLRDADGLNVLTGDMGGTTFDVGVVRRGQPLVRASTKYSQYEYFVPTLDVRSVGAGGGSIVHHDESTGSLRVGPRSAGAVPGPASYMRGGTEATVVDADVVLGYLNPEFFLGGNLSLDVDSAKRALEAAGKPLGFGVEETAAAAARIVDNQLADAIRLISVSQGYDPRDCVMYTYGGAGAVHCPAVAPGLGISKVVVPLGDFASGWSALGVASSDMVFVKEVAVTLPAPFDVEAMNAAWQTLESKVMEKLLALGLSSEVIQLERSVDVRYSLQINEVRVAAPGGLYDADAAAGLVVAFEEEYERLFGVGSGYADAGYMLTMMRVGARAPAGTVALGGEEEIESVPAPSPTSERPVVWYELGLEPRLTPIYAGSELGIGAECEGPAVIEFVDTTVVLREGQKARTDKFGSILITT